MKRMLVLLLTFVCLAILVACNPNSDISNDTTPLNNEKTRYFVGKVTEVWESGCQLEVTDVGNCGENFEIGAAVDVKTTLENCPQYTVGDYLRIEFEGIVAGNEEPYYVMCPTVIAKTDSNGNSLQ